MRSLRRLTLVLPVLLLLPLSALAQEGRVEQRIQSWAFSDPAYLQEAQQLQLLVGSLWTGESGEGSVTLPLGLEFGATERFEFDADVDLAIPAASSGSVRVVDRAEAGVMVGLVDDGARGVAVSAGLGFVGSRNRLDNGFDPGAAPHLSGFAQLGQLLTNLELSMDLISRNGEVDVMPEAALGLALDLGRLQPTLEAVYENEEAPTGIFALGLRFHPVKSLELGAAVPLQVSEGNTHVGVAGQLIWELGGS